MRKTYRLQTWRGWDKQLDAFARDFRAEFGRAPNLLVASPVTLRRLNLAANKTRVHNAKGDAPPPVKYVELSGFQAADYALTFVPEDEVDENCFALIHAFEVDELVEASA